MVKHGNPSKTYTHNSVTSNISGGFSTDYTGNATVRVNEFILSDGYSTTDGTGNNDEKIVDAYSLGFYGTMSNFLSFCKVKSVGYI